MGPFVFDFCSHGDLMPPLICWVFYFETHHMLKKQTISDLAGIDEKERN